MGELTDRRARKKALTRELIRSVARRLFDENGFEAVTIADIARASDVAVQTVFNHFATKEDLFFDGRTPWVDAPAQAVRLREASVAPLTALRSQLVDLVAELVGSLRCPERRRYIATLDASEALRAYERGLVHRSEEQLRQALLEAWSADDAISPSDPDAASRLIAAVWLAAGRSLVVGQRPRVTGGADPDLSAAAVMDLADRLLREMETTANVLHGPGPALPTDTGWPEATVRRAG
ncbi:TetR/AcrR family transcriptional regulator [Blastococcus sp. CT_GayMR16]|uniref:TetR/AcrR family transcriptional regulator n=1 Tax=Blastococcus sp. CT_GayMR16 TaxID=2559607 RepID=UPI0010737961|nr:TetR/AcrR family transcriptional regulator [Blastococcus sp. CT_GayMR16]TFV90332.1 TetR/AcrR family transcriptional regulator [Blastococcus sp. CT_GayMR16]